MKLQETLGLTVLLLFLVFAELHAQDNAPVFTIRRGGNLYTFDILENIPLGTEVFRLQASNDISNQTITYSVSPTTYFRVNNSLDGRVYLIQRLDRELVTSFTVQVTASDGSSQTTHSMIVNVLDVNDERPTFERTRYTSDLRENAPVNTVVFNNVQIFDSDLEGETLQVTCLPPEGSRAFNPCNYFEMRPTEASNIAWLGRMYLRRGIDFSNRDVIQIPIQVFDGQHYAIQSFEVNIRDNQNLPPSFVSSLSGRIQEDMRPGDFILQISATDPDRPARAVNYEIVQGSDPTGLFNLDPVTGVITLARPIRSQEFSQSFVTFNVLARERLPDNSLGNTQGVDMQQAQVTISIQDTNNNPPIFNPSAYTASVVENNLRDPCGRENIATLQVSDRDQGSNAAFEVTLNNHGQIFELDPSRAQGSAQISVFVRDKCLLDYDRGARTYNLQITARETDTPARLSGTASVLVTVRDGNDNRPMFPSNTVQAQVLEDAQAGTPVTTVTATDIDSGQNGNVCYKIEAGPGSNLFQINYKTGEITVRQCDTPGTQPCLDYEATRQVRLTITGRDKCGEGLETNTTVVVNVNDGNDNEPRFTLPQYIGWVSEGQVDPRITVQATDPDPDDTITYRIVGGNVGNPLLWTINPRTGQIMATSPVQYEDTPNGNGYYILTVEATDGRFSPTTNVRINVNDTNDSGPRFIPGPYYEVTIQENAATGTIVQRVVALDDDSPDTPNGQIDYRITSGSLGRFTINGQTGDVTTSGTFDITADRRNRYEMLILASDRGTPRQSATATLVVNINDVNNQNPVFSRRTYTATIREDAAFRTPVTTVTASDADNNAQLEYSFIEPISAVDSRRNPVNPNAYNFRNLFSIDPRDGLVRVQQELDYERAAEVTYTVLARDLQGSTQQTATATLIITITYVNTQPPVFPDPWSPQNQFIDITIKEEQRPNEFVTTIQASDPFETIRRYEITSDPDNLFAINPSTGVVTQTGRIDYEVLPRTQFTVIAVDSGNPALTSTATVRVTVENINDFNPRFTQTQYDMPVDENSPPGTVVGQVRATDGDPSDCSLYPKCEYGVIRYRLTGDPRFRIDQNTGLITVAPGAQLDREDQDVISFTVEAYDSPNTPSESRSTTSQIYVQLIDRNDNPPYFNPETYVTRIPENVPTGTSLVRLYGFDPDTGNGDGLTYTIVGGGPGNTLVINPNTGEITVGQPPRGQAGTYNVTVRVCDNGQPPMCADGRVTVIITAQNNFPPVFTWPSFNNQSIEVIENQYQGYIVNRQTPVRATDADDDAVTYGFNDGPGREFVGSTADFNINELTGIITTRRNFDREVRDTYPVLLVARDDGSPRRSAERYLLVKIKDADDNVPEFPKFANCCTIPYDFSVMENLPENTFVGQVKATDLDLGDFGIPLYKIEAAGNTNNSFKIDDKTGQIYTAGMLDREAKAEYTLFVVAASENSPTTAAGPGAPGCSPLCSNPSRVQVTVRIGDEDDSAPRFGYRVFNACVPYDAQFNKVVTTVRAIDLDTGVISKTEYGIVSADSFHTLGGTPTPVTRDTFGIGVTNGTVYTRALMQPYANHSFSLNVSAQDTAGRMDSTTLRIFVTDKSQEIKITVTQDAQTVIDNLDTYTQWIEETFPGSVVCVNDVRAYIDTDKNIVPGWSEIIFHVIDGGTGVPLKPDVVIPALEGHPRLGALLVVDVEPASSLWGGFDLDPVLIPVIIILLLLLLLLLLLCCLWCWFAAAAKRKRKEKATLLYAADPWAQNGSVNPMWKERLFEEQELNMNVDGGYKMDGMEMAVTAHANQGFVADETDGALVAAAAAGSSQQETRTETQQEYQMSYEHTKTVTEYQQQNQNGLSYLGAAASEPRIETTLERSAAAAHSMSAQNVYAIPHRGAGQGAGADMRAAHSTPAIHTLQVGQEQPRHNRSGIGATLSSSHTDLSQRSYSIMEMAGPGGLPSPAHTHDSFTSWGNRGAVPMGSSAPPSVHYGTANGHIVRDIHDDAPDGLYQGEILLGTYRPPHFPNNQQQILYTGPSDGPGVYDDVPIY